MSRTFTLAQMRTRALQLADRESDGALSTSEQNDAINAGVAFVWNKILKVAPAGEYAKDYTITTAAGTTSYSLPADFRSALALLSQENTDGTRRPVQQVNTFDRTYYKQPGGVYTLTLEYVPNPTILVSDSDTFDGISGYEEIACAHAARRFMQKEETDPTVVETILSEWVADLVGGYEPSRGPKFVTDVDAYDARIFPTLVGIRAYRIRKPNIELYEPVIPFW